MKCDNCSEDALYKDAPPTVSVAYFCERHLPDYLQVGKERLLMKDEKKKSSKAVEPEVEAEPEVTE